MTSISMLGRLTKNSTVMNSPLALSRHPVRHTHNLDSG